MQSPGLGFDGGSQRYNSRRKSDSKAVDCLERSDNTQAFLRISPERVQRHAGRGDLDRRHRGEAPTIPGFPSPNSPNLIKERTRVSRASIPSRPLKSFADPEPPFSLPPSGRPTPKLSRFEPTVPVTVAVPARFDPPVLPDSRLLTRQLARPRPRRQPVLASQLGRIESFPRPFARLGEGYLIRERRALDPLFCSVRIGQREWRVQAVPGRQEAERGSEGFEQRCCGRVAEDLGRLALAPERVHSATTIDGNTQDWLDGQEGWPVVSIPNRYEVLLRGPFLSILWLTHLTPLAGSGWFAPLVEPEEPMSREERAAAEKARIEKLKDGRASTSARRVSVPSQTPRRTAILTHARPVCSPV